MTITLQEEIGPNQAMILVDHPEETSLDDMLQIDAEYVVVRSVSADSLLLGRGALGSTRVSHAVGATVSPAVIGSSVTLSPTDPGALGAGVLWLQTDPDDNFSTQQLWVRNEDDDGWLPVALGNSYSNNGFESAGFWDRVSGNEYAAVDIRAGQGVFLRYREDPADNATIRSLRVDRYGVAVVSATTTVHQLVGTVDPTVGGGLVAEVGSTYHRNSGGTGELWLKTGAGDTAWSKGGLTPYEFLYNSNVGQSVPPSTPTLLNWAPEDALVSAMLNLSDPTHPTILVAGLYHVHSQVWTSNGTQAGKTLGAALRLDATGREYNLYSQGEIVVAPAGLVATAGEIATGAAYYLPTGAQLTLTVGHDAVGSLDVHHETTIQRIS